MPRGIQNPGPVKRSPGFRRVTAAKAAMAAPRNKNAPMAANPTGFRGNSFIFPNNAAQTEPGAR